MRLTQISAAILLLLTATIAQADDALQFFTNQATANLLARFGFGVTNIPIYSPTNDAVRYSAALHYELQAAANAWDITTPATNYPSAFRPLFAWQGSNLFIIGYTNVVTDFDAQLAAGFKEITDPSIGVNDNIWGIPWVVGAKDNSPQFNDFENFTVMSMERKLNVRRPSSSPSLPVLTNQWYLMEISNSVGFDVWNTAQDLQNPVEIIASNKLEVLFTNNYNWGTNFELLLGTNLWVTNWPDFDGEANHSPSIVSVQLSSLEVLPLSVWAELTAQMLPLNATTPWETNSGLPVHDWELFITNSLVYALCDNRSGPDRPLDFVNIRTGNSLDWNTSLQLFNNPRMSWIAWATNFANDTLTSPASMGVSNQLLIGAGLISVSDWADTSGSSSNFRNFMQGRASKTNYTACPFEPWTIIYQLADLPAFNPKAHYTIEDLGSTLPGPIISIINPTVGFNPLAPNLGNGNRSFISALPFLQNIELSSNTFSLAFTGAPDVPYMIFASSNLADWAQIGTATQPAPGIFQFTAPATNAVARFYKIVTP